MKSHELQRIRNLLGPFAVLLPIQRGMKGPVFKNWQRTTVNEAGTPEYEKRLIRHGNLGVLLGRPSAGLCSIDIDSDAAAEEFLALNPRLAKSLRSRGMRGQNVWVRVTGEYPPLSRLVRGDSNWGEWRADGGQTVIAGTHPSGCSYLLLQEASPVEVRFSDICWPPGVVTATPVGGHRLSPLPDSSEYPALPESPAKTASLHHSTSTASLRHSTSLHPLRHLHHTPEPDASGVAGIEELPMGLKALEIESRFRSDFPEHARLYEQLVEHRFPAEQGSRNAAIVSMIPFLYRAVGETVLKKFVGLFFDVNQGTWIDSREQHLREAGAQLHAVQETYVNELSALELSYYAHLQVNLQEVFRICRDLGLRDSDDLPAGCFFLSCNQLGLRILCHPMEAHRYLKKLVKYGILDLVELGERRTAGSRCRSSVWRWRLRGQLSRSGVPLVPGGTSGESAGGA